MSDEHQVILDRANRILKQSRTLRRLSDELLQESRDIRASVKGKRRTKRAKSDKHR